MTPTDQAALVVERRKLSFDWQRQNFYDQWRKVHRLYKCEVDPAKDENNPEKDDPTKTRIGMPDTWSLVQRQVARITAQPPNLKYRADDLDLAKKISRKLMYDWDRGGVQRGQKRHVAQACLFGISIRAWSWETMEYPRTKRVDPLNSEMDDNTRAAIHDQYGEQLQGYRQEINNGLPPESQEPFGGPTAMAKLMGDHSRGNLLPIKQTFKKYQGPKSSFLFIGDCFFEPNFEEFQTQNWFIVERRRNKAWLNSMGRRYPELGEGIDKLFTDYPQGTPYRSLGPDAQNLRNSMMGDIDRIDSAKTSASAGNTPMWTVTEMWEPGEDARVCFVGEDTVYIGDIDQPYDLDGKIPFTSLVLIDDILSGVGDSAARIIRGLNELHNNHNNQRYALIDAIQKPLYFTSDQALYDNPGLMKRGDGFRLIHARPGAIPQTLNEGPAQASAAAGMRDEEGILRMIQMATGESNMSMAANVDPSANRTATGSRLQAFNQDILSKSATDMFNHALNADAEMMYLLNRSEMPEAVTFDAAPYSRSYSTAPAPSQAAPQLPPAIGQPSAPGIAPAPQQDMLTVSPLDFQIDGEVEAEVGSTLADDDDAEVVKAQNFFAMAVANPQLYDVQWAAMNLAIRFGYAKSLGQVMAKPQPPQPPEQPKLSGSVSIKFETLATEVQVSVLEKFGLPVPADMQQHPGMLPQIPGETGAMSSNPAPKPVAAPHVRPPAKGGSHSAKTAPPQEPGAMPTALEAAEGIRMPTQ